MWLELEMVSSVRHFTVSTILLRPAFQMLRRGEGLLRDLTELEVDIVNIVRFGLKLKYKLTVKLDLHRRADAHRRRRHRSGLVKNH